MNKSQDYFGIQINNFSKINPQQTEINLKCCMPANISKWKNVEVFTARKNEKEKKKFLKITQFKGSNQIQLTKNKKDFSTTNTSSKTIIRQQSYQDFQKVKTDFMDQLKSWQSTDNFPEKLITIRPFLHTKTPRNERNDQKNSENMFSVRQNKQQSHQRLREILKQKWRTHTLKSIQQVQKYCQTSDAVLTHLNTQIDDEERY